MSNHHICRYFLLPTVFLLLGLSLHAQEYTTEQIFDSVQGFSFPNLQFSQKGDIFLFLTKGHDKHTLYRSTNEGLTWNIVRGVPKDDYTFRVNPLTGSFFYEKADADHRSDTLYRSKDGGKSWKVVFLSPMWGNLRADRDGEMRFTEWRSGEYYISTDDGDSWQKQKKRPLTADTKLDAKPGIACSGGSGDMKDGKSHTFYSLHDGVYFTADSGKTWKRSSYWKKLFAAKGNIYCIQGFAIDSNGWLYHGVNVLKDKKHLLELNPSNGRWYNSHGFYLVRSKDEGRNWDTLSVVMDGKYNMGSWGVELQQLDFDREGNIVAFTSGGIYRSKDNGKTYDLLDVPNFTYFGCTMQKDFKGNIYLVTTLPGFGGNHDNYGLYKISP